MTIRVEAGAFIASDAHGAGGLRSLTACVGESGAGGAAVAVSAILIFVDTAGIAEGMGRVKLSIVEAVARRTHVTVGMVVSVVMPVAAGTGDTGAGEAELGGVAVTGARRANLMAVIMSIGEGVSRGAELARAAGRVVPEAVNVVLHEVEAIGNQRYIGGGHRRYDVLGTVAAATSLESAAYV